MVPPAGGGKPTLRKAHFIKPTLGHKNETFTSLESQPLLPPTPDPKIRHLSMTLKLHCLENLQKNWESWVAKNGPRWKQAGICGAVLSSTYKINADRDVILGFAERWCQETKSFIFPWGEATITLEDVMVLGSPVFPPLETEELKAIEDKLDSVRREIMRNEKSHRARQIWWMEKFVDSESQIEHEAFIAMWLSRFVFPSQDSVYEIVIPLAVHLARGTRISLAPAVLAHIYRDLTILKMRLQRAEIGEDKECSMSIHLRSPFQLVQVWVWERFLCLGPKPNVLNNGDVRLARWQNLKCQKVENLRLILDSAGESFDWRPYAKTLSGWHVPKFYREEGSWVSVDSLDDELLAFARSIRLCQLVGLNCLEQYLPNRVGLQFGMDQDIPNDVAISNSSHEGAWDDFVQIGDGKMYVPHRLFEGDVTVRYVEWWRQ